MYKNRIKIFIVDDHQMIIEGLNSLLHNEDCIELVGSANSAERSLQFLKSHTCDVILMDINLPETSGIELCAMITKTYPLVKIIALSTFNQGSYVRNMMQSGANGYLLKNADKHEILEAIENVYEGNVYYCKHTTSNLASMIVKSKFNPLSRKEAIVFNDREIEIIKLICLQCTALEIGKRLFISKRTVEGYRTKILEKINAKNTAGVVVYALKNHLIKESELL